MSAIRSRLMCACALAFFVFVAQAVQAQTPSPGYRATYASAAGGAPNQSVGVPAGVVATRSAAGTDASGNSCALSGGCGNMTQHGGVVQHTQKVFTIFWQGSGSFPAGYQSTINQFVQDLNGSSYYGVNTQYTDGSGAISSTVVFGGTWLDTSNAVPSLPTFTDLNAEVSRAETANGWTGDGNSYFQIYTPSGVANGDASNICGLHYFSTVPIGQILFPFPGCFPGGTYPNSANADAAINVSAHEISETVTDPHGNAWYFNNTGGEIGDECNFIFGTRASDGSDVTLNGHDYLVQELWSNAVTNCSLAPPTSPPVVTANPVASLTVLTGQTIFLASSASGAPTPNAQWQVSLNGGSTWTNIAGATSPNLSFAAERFDNGKQYRCFFSNSSGNAITSTAALFVRLRVRNDFDNDRRTDLAVWRPSNGYFFWLTSSTGYNPSFAGVKQWGNQSLGDQPLSGDMDGDGIEDLIVWRASTGTFIWLTSTTGYNYSASQSHQWGNSAQGDQPFIGDIDGDGKGDLIVWRPTNGTWYSLLSSTGYNSAFAQSNQWGNSSLGDIPLLGDFDGDGLADFAVWRASNGYFFWLTSSTGYSTSSFGSKQWGNSSLGDQPIIADIDGDGVSDLVVWRSSNGYFFWLTSQSGYNYSAFGEKQWGASTDIPLLADIDGDGAADLIVWRPSTGTYFWLTSSTGYNYASQGQRQWGANGDTPLR